MYISKIVVVAHKQKRKLLRDKERILNKRRKTHIDDVVASIEIQAIEQEICAIDEMVKVYYRYMKIEID